MWPDPQVAGKASPSRSTQPVPELARRHSQLAERLALIDAIRMGDPRVRGLATKLLGQRLARPEAAA